MTVAKTIDGRILSQKIRKGITDEISVFKARTGIVPKLAVVLVGNNPASLSYVAGKNKACKEVGIESREIKLDASTTEKELIDVVVMLNADPTVNGILVQLPLPKHINEKAIIDAIAPSKDVDGFTPINVGRMSIGEKCFIPCTPHGILKLIEMEVGEDLTGKHVVVIGRSNIVGKPIAALLSQKKPNATVTICHTGTSDLSHFTKDADILVVASGHPNTITKDMVKPGAIIIDVGVNRIADNSNPKGYRLVGDVDFDGCKTVASAITPVPGGVGPMTITMLLWNTFEAAKAILSK